nr:nucleolar protein of 40 kDa-like [Cavia porcellus]
MEALSKSQAVGSKIKNDRIKLSLSKKVVNQGTGKDLHPSSTIIEQEESGGGLFNFKADLSTNFMKCVWKGHFGRDCFIQPGGPNILWYPVVKKEKEEAKSAESEKPDSMENPSRKKKRKKKKHTSRKLADSDSSDAASDAAKWQVTHEKTTRQ